MTPIEVAPQQSSPAAWGMPTGFPVLSAGAVQVWKARVTEWAGREACLGRTLSAEEQGRAGRFRFGRDRTPYVVAHGLTRHLLAHYTGIPAGELCFATGPHGKPRLLGCPGAAPLEFNLSHSADLVLLAVTRHGPVGVDVERWIESGDLLELARQFFSPCEREQLLALPAARRVPAFFSCWSRKEAYLKATGLGVSQGLDYFDVTVGEDRPPRLLADRRAAANGRPWQMLDLALAPGYSGALVVAGEPRSAERYELGASHLRLAGE